MSNPKKKQMTLLQSWASIDKIKSKAFCLTSGVGNSSDIIDLCESSDDEMLIRALEESAQGECSSQTIKPEITKLVSSNLTTNPANAPKVSDEPDFGIYWEGLHDDDDLEDEEDERLMSEVCDSIEDTNSNLTCHMENKDSRNLRLSSNNLNFSVIASSTTNIGISKDGCTGFSSSTNIIASECNGFDIKAGCSWIYPINRPIRNYQFNIVQKALFNNTLVCLPTGLGKTFIAAVVMFNFYRWYPGGKVVFMAPTKPLVAQQIRACYEVVGIPMEDTAEMTGAMQPEQRKIAWQSQRAFYLTPQVMMNDLQRGACPALEVKCLVVDEAHKALGNHAYCQVVKELHRYDSSEFRIVALSATPGNDMKAVRQVITNLLISHVELRTEDSLDIQPYTHQRKMEKIVIPLGEEITRASWMYLKVIEKIVERLKRFGAMSPCNLKSLSKFIILKAREAFRNNPPSRVDRMQKGMIEGDFAMCISLYHGYELLQQHGLRSLLSYLRGVLDGKTSNSSADPAAASGANNSATNSFVKKFRSELLGNPDFVELFDILEKNYDPIKYADPNKSLQLTQHSQPSDSFGHPKIKKLLEVVIEHFDQFERDGLTTRVMIFSSYRDSVNEITQHLNRHHPKIKAMSFIGHSSTGGGAKGFNQKDQLKVMEKFRDGGYNALVSTCIGEEGLDIGEVDLIICFDVHKSPIRLVQRMGRTGRKRQGRVVVLVTEGKEEKAYNTSQSCRNTIVKIIQSGSLKLQLYNNSPLMIPANCNPVCQKTQITIPEFQANVSKSRASLSSHGSAMKMKNRSQSLTEEMMDGWRKDGLNNDGSSKFIFQPTRMLCLGQKQVDTSSLIGPQSHTLALDKYSLPLPPVNYSHLSKYFNELMEFIGVLGYSSSGLYETEMKLSLNMDDVITKTVQLTSKTTSEKSTKPKTRGKSKVRNEKAKQMKIKKNKKLTSEFPREPRVNHDDETTCGDSKQSNHVDDDEVTNDGVSVDGTTCEGEKHLREEEIYLILSQTFQVPQQKKVLKKVLLPANDEAFKMESKNFVGDSKLSKTNAQIFDRKSEIVGDGDDDIILVCGSVSADRDAQNGDNDDDDDDDQNSDECSIPPAPDLEEVPLLLDAFASCCINDTIPNLDIISLFCKWKKIDAIQNPPVARSELNRSHMSVGINDTRLEQDDVFIVDDDGCADDAVMPTIEKEIASGDCKSNGDAIMEDEYKFCRHQDVASSTIAGELEKESNFSVRQTKVQNLTGVDSLETLVAVTKEPDLKLWCVSDVESCPATEAEDNHDVREKIKGDADVVEDSFENYDDSDVVPPSPTSRKFDPDVVLPSPSVKNSRSLKQFHSFSSRVNFSRHVETSLHHDVQTADHKDTSSKTHTSRFLSKLYGVNTSTPVVCSGGLSSSCHSGRSGVESDLESHSFVGKLPGSDEPDFKTFVEEFEKSFFSDASEDDGDDEKNQLPVDHQPLLRLVPKKSGERLDQLKKLIAETSQVTHTQALECMQYSNIFSDSEDEKQQPSNCLGNKQEKKEVEPATLVISSMAACQVDMAANNLSLCGTAGSKLSNVEDDPHFDFGFNFDEWSDDDEVDKSTNPSKDSAPTGNKDCIVSNKHSPKNLNIPRDTIQTNLDFGASTFVLGSQLSKQTSPKTLRGEPAKSITLQGSNSQQSGSAITNYTALNECREKQNVFVKHSPNDGTSMFDELDDDFVSDQILKEMSFEVRKKKEVACQPSAGSKNMFGGAVRVPCISSTPKQDFKKRKNLTWSPLVDSPIIAHPRNDKKNVVLSDSDTSINAPKSGLLHDISNVTASDDDLEDFSLDRHKERKGPSKSISRKLFQQKMSSDVKKVKQSTKPRRRGEEFLDQEAEVSSVEEVSSDEQEEDDKDEYEMSFIDNHTDDRDSIDQQAFYNNLDRDRRSQHPHLPGKFKLKYRTGRSQHVDVFSQEEPSMDTEDDDYAEDSFCVAGSFVEYEDTTGTSKILDLEDYEETEFTQKERRRLKRKKEEEDDDDDDEGLQIKMKKGRRRIIMQDSTDDSVDHNNTHNINKTSTISGDKNQDISKVSPPSVACKTNQLTTCTPSKVGRSGNCDEKIDLNTSSCSSSSSPFKSPSLISRRRLPLTQKNEAVGSSKNLAPQCDVRNGSSDSGSSALLASRMNSAAVLVGGPSSKAGAGSLVMKADSNSRGNAFVLHEYRAPSKPIIFVSSRCVSSAQSILSSLRFDHRTDVVVRSFCECDFIVSNRAAVERMYLSDFVSFAKRDKNLGKLRDLLLKFDRVFLIVEKESGKNIDTKISLMKTKYSTNLLASLVTSPIRVLHSDSQSQTATLISNIEQNERMKGFQICLDSTLLQKTIKTLPFYSTIPTLSYISACNLSLKFPTIKDFTNSTSEVIAKAGCISEEKGRQVYKYIRHSFDAQMTSLNSKKL